MYFLKIQYLSRILYFTYCKHETLIHNTLHINTQLALTSPETQRNRIADEHLDKIAVADYKQEVQLMLTTGAMRVLSCTIIIANLLVEYHDGGGESWHANRRTSGQLSFECSWILLLNNNSRELVPITDCSDSKWVAQPSRRCPYFPEFVSMICSGPVVRSHQNQSDLD